MADQANKLRDLFKSKQTDELTLPTVSSRVIAITSGKGGVGKTNLAVNLAINLTKHDKRVIVIDADFGLANIEVLLGIIPKYTFGDVLSGTITIEEALTAGPNDIKFLSGGSGMSDLANMSEKQMSVLIQGFTALDSMSDIILIDTGAGISKSVLNFVRASNETILITTPEPTSITDAYAIIKTVKEESQRDEKPDIPQFKIIVNRADSYEEGEDIFNKLSLVSEKFLNIKVQKLGIIPYDNTLVKAVKRQQPVSLLFPSSDCAKSIDTIAQALLNMEVKKNARPGGIMTFMKKLVNVFNNPG